MGNQEDSTKLNSLQIDINTLNALMSNTAVSTVEPKEGDHYGNVEFINPASVAGQAYIDQITTNQPGVDGNYDQETKQVLDKELLDDYPGYRKDPQDEAHQELLCAIEGPCEINSHSKMFSTPEEDFQEKLNAHYLNRIQEEIKSGTLFTREGLNREIEIATEKYKEDLKYNLGNQLLKRLLGNSKGKVLTQERLQDQSDTLELLESGVVITEEIESLSYGR